MKFGIFPASANNDGYGRGREILAAGSPSSAPAIATIAPGIDTKRAFFLVQRWPLIGASNSSHFPIQKTARTITGEKSYNFVSKVSKWKPFWMFWFWGVDLTISNAFVWYWPGFCAKREQLALDVSLSSPAMVAKWGVGSYSILFSCYKIML